MFVKSIKKDYKSMEKKLFDIGFKKKNNNYYRIYGDDIFQIVTVDRKKFGINLFVDQRPLYSPWEEIECEVSLSDLAWFNFQELISGESESKCKEDSQTDVQKQFVEYIQVFQDTKSAEDLFNARRRMVLSTVDTYVSETEELNYLHSKIPELPDIKFACKDEGIIFTLIRANQFDEASRQIDFFYKLFLYDLQTELKEGTLDEDHYSKTLKSIESEFKDVLKMKDYLDRHDIEKIEETMKKNVKTNKAYLKQNFQLEV